MTQTETAAAAPAWPGREEREAAWARRREAARTAGVCGRCGRSIGPAEPVWWGDVPLWSGHFPDDPPPGARLVELERAFGGPRAPRVRYEPAPRCASCHEAAEREAEAERAALTARWGREPPWAPQPAPALRPCESCGRPVSRRAGRREVSGRHIGRWVTPAHACSDRCLHALYDARRPTRTEAGAARAHKTCPVCGEAFDGTRRDQVTCSPACRQKAYRRRRRDSAPQ